MTELLSDPEVQEYAAAAAFVLLVSIPVLRAIAKRTKTPIDDRAVSVLERVLKALRGR